MWHERAVGHNDRRRRLASHPSPPPAAHTTFGLTAQQVHKSSAAGRHRPGDTSASRTATDSAPDYSQPVSPTVTTPQTVAFDGAEVVVEPGAVTDPVTIGISVLSGTGLAKLYAGMPNVTGSPRSGFRFAPHPVYSTANGRGPVTAAPRAGRVTVRT
jgi:hypothetical protein